MSCGRLVAFLVCSGTLFVACGETAPPTPPAAASSTAALLSCNTTPDCAGITTGSCVTIACTAHVCTQTDSINCCAQSDGESQGVRNARCNDGNACTGDTCLAVALGSSGMFNSSCVHVGDVDALGCCAMPSDCAAANECQTGPACTNNSCTYVAKRDSGSVDAPNAGCCDSNADCSVGTCNRATNRCVCAGIVCPGPNNTETCATECCTDGECSLPNAEEQCKDGVCTVKGCVPPFADCNKAVDDGCEVNTNTDEANCGGCAMPCNGATGACEINECTTGSCTVIRNPSPAMGVQCCDVPGDCSSVAKCTIASCVLHQCVFAADPACNDMAAPPDLRPPADLATTPDLATTLDMATSIDLAVSVDLATTPDLAVPADQSIVADLSSPPDLTVEADLSIGLDLLVEADLTGVSLDLTPVEDLSSLDDLTGVTPPDLVAPRPDLQTTLSATGGSFGCATSGEPRDASWLGVVLALAILAVRSRPRRASSRS